jgi:YegS/Rv2252/BmrU family lipid kinase
MKKAALIFNPRAGSWRTEKRIVAIRAALTEAGYATKPLPTQAPGHASQLAGEAAESGFEVVFTFGGDGTLREAAAGLVGSDTALAPVPGGTVNVVAMALGLPQDPVRAARMMKGAEPFDMDVGMCGEEAFLMQTSAGLDAHIMGNLRPGLKRRFGKAAIVLAGLNRLATYGFPEIGLVADGRPLTASLVAVCNLSYYAGPFKMAPDASVSDRLLDLVIFRGSGRLRTLAFGLNLIFGRHLHRPDVEVVRVKMVTLRGPQDLSRSTSGYTHRQ